MKAASETITFGFGCGLLCLSFNQIAGFFNHQCFWKKLMDLLDFLHGNNHQGKVAC